MNVNNANTYLPDSPVAPQFLVIASITRANPMVVTVSTPNEYIAGQNFYFSVPDTYGMYQVNALTVNITSVDSTNLIFTMALDSSNFDPFVIPSGVRVQQPATVAPQGSRNTLNYTTMPFHSIDGSVGN